MTRDASVDVIRASAIILVIAHHASHSFSVNISGFQHLASDYGHLGVQLFFMASAYTMMLTFGREVNVALTLSFYVRRFFRIAPLFWLAGAAYFMKDGFSPRHWAPDGIYLSDIFYTVSFLHWVRPHSINSVVPGGWSIAVEMLFYAAFPALAYIHLVARRPWLVYLLLVALYLMGLLARAALAPTLYSSYGTEHRHVVDGFFRFWPPYQLLAFGCGFLLFDLIVDRKTPILGTFLILSASYFTDWGLQLIILFLFCVIVLKLEVHQRVLEIVGQASYSIYLIHFAVISALEYVIGENMGNLYFEAAFFVILGVSFPIAHFLTKPLVEDPFIKVGKIASARLKLWLIRPPRAVFPM